MAKRRKRKTVKPTAGNPWPKRLLDFRDRHDLSQQDAANLCRVTRRAWIFWENGEKAPSPTYELLLDLAIKNKDRKN